MDDRDTPRGRDALIVAALVAGATNAEAAQAAGCSVTTVQRTRRRWRDVILADRADRAEQVAAGLLGMADSALDALRTLLDSNVPGIRFAAARYALDAALRWRDSTDVEARLSALESATEPARWSA